MQGFYQTHPMRFMVGAFILGIVTVACMCGAAPAYAQSYFDEASIYNWFVTQQDVTKCDNGKKDIASQARGLLESYPENPNQTEGNPNVSCAGFIYDEALAGLVFLSRGDLSRAKRILDFFITYKNNHPGFNGFSFGFDLSTGEPWIQSPIDYFENRTGDNAWVGIFALEYYLLTKDENAYLLARAIADWLTSEKAPSIPATLKANNIVSLHPGMVPFSTASSSDAVKPYANFSTEKNLSTVAFLNKFKLFADKRADSIVAVNRIDEKIEGIAAFLGSMWDPSAHLFNAGQNFTNRTWNTDTHKVLDVNSWFLLAADVGHIVNMTGPDVKVFTDAIEQNFAQVVDQNVTGFDFIDRTQRQTPVKWIEGTNGMIVAYKKLLDLAKLYKSAPYIAHYQSKVDQLLQASQADVRHKECFRLSLPYTNSAKSIVAYPFWGTYDTSLGTSVASTAWAMFSLSGTNPMYPTLGFDGSTIPDMCCAANKTCSSTRTTNGL